MYPRQYYYLIQTVVEILDVNDHVPRFPEAEISLRIPESARPGATLDLPRPWIRTGDVRHWSTTRLGSPGNNLKFWESRG